MNVLKVGDSVTAIFEDGRMLSLSDCPNELFMKIINNDYTYEEVVKMLIPDFVDTIRLKKFITEESTWLRMKGNSVIMPSVSELSIPDDFVEKFVDAEKSGNEDLMTTYKNFWTLVSLNPDSRVRDNIFWFIRRWDMKISKSGLIIAYRNADIKKEGTEMDIDLIKLVTNEREKIKFVSKKSPKNYKVVKYLGNYYVVKEDQESFGAEEIGNLEELHQRIVESKEETATVFTDHHSHTFDIRIGQIVRMPREETDSCQDNTCSRGLHVASKGWLKQNYYGSVGLKVLVNPAFVVAVPPQDNYGKMRTCEYLPIGTVDFDEFGDVIDDISTDAYEDDYFNTICYEGNINNEDPNGYALNIPDMIEVDKEAAWENLRQIAKSLRNE